MFVVTRSAFALFMLRSFLYGAAVGAGYLVLGALRMVLQKLPRGFAISITAATDFVFCLVCAFFALLMIYVSNRGQMRIAALLFFVAGLYLVLKVLMKPVYALEKRLLAAIKRKVLDPMKTAFTEFFERLKERASVIRQRRAEKAFDRNFENHLEKELVSAFEEGFLRASQSLSGNACRTQKRSHIRENRESSAKSRRGRM